MSKKKEYNIVLNENEKDFLIHFMQKHLSIFNNLIKVRDNEKDKKEKFLRENLLISLYSAKPVEED